jgi:predicted  nucleic acid-binding Zn-ribbon protein
MRKILKKKKFILKDAGQGTYNAGEVISMLESMTDSINLIAEQQADIIKEIKKINERLDKLEARMDSMEAKMGKMEKDIVEIKNTLKGKAERIEVKDLGKRMIRLEKFSVAH